MTHPPILVLFALLTTACVLAQENCFASCARNCHVCANIDTSGVALKSDWSENAFPSETRAVPLGSDVYINGQRIGTVNCASTNGAICIRASGLEIERDVLLTTGEFGLECRCNNELKDCSVVTVGLFNGKRELFDVTSVACGSCATTKGQNDPHAMPLRILNGSFDYQDLPTEQQPQPQPLPQPLPQVSQSQFVNQPVTKNEEKAPFFGQIVPISGEARSGEDEKFVEFCTSLDTSGIIDSDWEERADSIHSKGKKRDSKNFLGDGQFVGTVTCASTKGQVCIRGEGTNIEKVFFITQPFGLLCRCTASGCSAGTFGFGRDGAAEDQLIDIVYVGCGPCKSTSPDVPVISPQSDSSDERVDSFGPAPPGEVPQALPFDVLPNAFEPNNPPGTVGPPAPFRSQQGLPIPESGRFLPNLNSVSARARAAPTLNNIPAVNAEKARPLTTKKPPPTSVCAGFSSTSITSEADWVEQKYPSQTVSLTKGIDLYTHTTVIGTLSCWDSGEWRSCITGKRLNGTIASFESEQYTSTLLQCRCTGPYDCHVVSEGFKPHPSNQFIDVVHIACGRC